jgi:hypothetical protein
MSLKSSKVQIAILKIDNNKDLSLGDEVGITMGDTSKPGTMSKIHLVKPPGTHVYIILQ